MSCANLYSSHYSIGLRVRFFNQGFWLTAPLAMFIEDENEVTSSQISRWRYPFLALLQKSKIFFEPSLPKTVTKKYTAF